METTAPTVRSTALDGWIRERDLVAVADAVGTPCYVYDAVTLERAAAAARAVVGPDTRLYFSLKSNPHPEVHRVLSGAGLWAEVSSAAELETVLSQGVPASRVMFLGPGKSEGEIRRCVRAGVLLVVESLQELDDVERTAAEEDTEVEALLRVNPAFETKAAGLRMGGAPRQFGIDEAQLSVPLHLADRAPRVRVRGLHAYMGTRLLQASTVVENTERILEMAERLADVQGIPLDLVDVGGGWGVPYFENEAELDLDALADGLAPVFAGFRQRRPGTCVAVELGRFLTAHAGALLARVRYTKESMGARFAVLDGGTNVHMAAVGIGSFVKRDFPVTVLAPAEGFADTHAWTLTGPLCTPNDVVAKSVELEGVGRGALLAVTRSGAYGPSASPGLFLSHGFPAEAMITADGGLLVSPADTVQDVLRRRTAVPVDPS